MSHPNPTEIHLHKQSRVLEISFDDGNKYSYPAEYLRVFSPSAEVQGHGPGQEVLQVGKEEVNIAHIEPVGNYAICLHFDDEHNTGIYSWDTYISSAPILSATGKTICNVCRRQVISVRSHRLNNW
jgi:DUF971 family protein